jgi:hypothetical protein
LEKNQLVLLAVALGPVLVSVVLFRNLSVATRLLLVWGAPLGVLAAGSWRGRSILSRVLNEGLWWVQRRGGQTVATPPLRVKAEQGRLSIPGAVGERCHVLPIIDIKFLDGQAFIWDKNPKNQCATAVISVKTEGWLLADDGVKTSRFDAVNQLCKNLATQGGIARVATIARAYPASVDSMAVPAKIYEDSLVGEFTRLEYADMLSTGEMESVLRRDMLIAITVNYKAAQQEIQDHGGGVEGVSAVLVNRVMRMLNMLKDCGVRTSEYEWLTGNKLRGSIRLAMDIWAADWLIRNDFEHPEEIPLTHEARNERTHLITNDTYHRCWWIERWPATQTNAGVMNKLIGGGEMPHTVTQIWEPVDLYQSEKKFINQIQSKETARKMNEKLLGRPESVNSLAENSDMALRHYEMQQGFGDVRYSGFVTVHAKSLSELNKSDMWVREAGGEMMLNKATARQYATFITACLPLGLRDGDV